MEIIHKVKMDLSNPGSTPRINVVQGDTYTRKLSIALYSGRKPWRIPSDASVVIRYRKPDRTSGTYDTLSDGSSAVSFSGNTIHIIVAPEALSLAGAVTLMVTILLGEQRLTTFAMELQIAPDCVSGWSDEEGAAWIAAFLPSPDSAEQGQHFVVDQVDDNGHVLSVKTVDLAQWLETYLKENGIVESVSISHEWDGTTLTVTSASGTSSVDLKGEDGKSAYVYAAEGGYKGTEAEFTEQLGMIGAEEVVVSSTAPEDENAKIWINPDEEKESSGAQIDVTAEVGQTIVVKAIDDNGKPTQWEAVDLPNGASSWDDLTDKPFGETLIEVFPTAEVVTVDGTEAGLSGQYLSEITITHSPRAGDRYKAIVNGVAYEGVATAEPNAGVVMMGNLSFVNVLIGTTYEDTGEPFVMWESDTLEMMCIFSISTVTLNLMCDAIVPIPTNYLPDVPYLPLGQYGSLSHAKNLTFGDAAQAEIEAVLNQTYNGGPLIVNGIFASADGNMTNCVSIPMSVSVNEGYDLLGVWIDNTSGPAFVIRLHYSDGTLTVYCIT